MVQQHWIFQIKTKTIIKISEQREASERFKGDGVHLEWSHQRVSEPASPDPMQHTGLFR